MLVMFWDVRINIDLTNHMASYTLLKVIFLNNVTIYFIKLIVIINKFIFHAND